jgi:hypothetical protein
VQYDVTLKYEPTDIIESSEINHTLKKKKKKKKKKNASKQRNSVNMNINNCTKYKISRSYGHKFNNLQFGFSTSLLQYGSIV